MQLLILLLVEVACEDKVNGLSIMVYGERLHKQYMDKRQF